MASAIYPSRSLLAWCTKDVNRSLGARSFEHAVTYRLVLTRDAGPRERCGYGDGGVPWNRRKPLYLARSASHRFLGRGFEQGRP